MALDQSALLEVLDVLKAAGVGDRVRSAGTIYQASIEAELTDAIGAGCTSAPMPGLLSATGTAPGC